MCMILEMTYFRAGLVQLIVSRSDSELKVQRYGMKKNTVTVDPIMLQDELWMKQREKPSPNRRSRFLETEPRKPSFRFLNFEVGSVWFLENRYPKFWSDSAHPRLHSQRRDTLAFVMIVTWCEIVDAVTVTITLSWHCDISSCVSNSPSPVSEAFLRDLCQLMAYHNQANQSNGVKSYFSYLLILLGQSGRLAANLFFRYLLILLFVRI